MSHRPKFKLSRLREIGWARWDPIGLGGIEGDIDDEYDTYLLRAAGMLWNGAGAEQVVDYLAAVEAGDMGLAMVPGIRERAADTVSALSLYVEEVRAGDER